MGSLCSVFSQSLSFHKVSARCDLQAARGIPFGSNKEDGNVANSYLKMSEQSFSSFDNGIRRWNNNWGSTSMISSLVLKLDSEGIVLTCLDRLKLYSTTF